MGSSSERNPRVAPPTLAAITLAVEGGGVASVSRLLWQVCQDRWGSQTQLVTLDRGALPAGGAHRWTDRVSFGLDVLARQLVASSGWVLFAHAGLARAQAYVPRRLRRPYAVFLHGIEVWRPLDAALEEALAGATLILANSSFTADRARRFTPTLGAIEVCPLAREREPDTMPAGVSIEGSHDVLIVGRLDAAERYKGHDELIDVWPLVVAEVADARLVIVGDGDDRARLEADVRARGLNGQVTFSGFIPAEERRRQYERAALFAMPSRGEGFGLVYLEAMAHGLACLGSVHDAAGEIIVDGVTGRLVDVTRRDDLARAVIDLLRDDRRRRELGRLGRVRERDVFGYDRFSGRLNTLLDGAFS
jgi:phosphatidyl-myo-inositol dimannoside synthase